MCAGLKEVRGRAMSILPDGKGGAWAKSLTLMTDYGFRRVISLSLCLRAPVVGVGLRIAQEGRGQRQQVAGEACVTPC